MIVATSSYLLAASPSAINPRILWRNRIENLLASRISVSGETVDGPRDAPTRPNTDEYWEPPSLPAWITFDLGSSYTISGVGIAGHSFGTNQTTVLVEVGPDASFATPGVFAQDVLPGDDAALLFLDADRVGRYVRITLTGTTPPIVPVVYAGDVLAMEKAVAGPYKPIGRSRQTILRGRRSRGGQFLGQNIRSHGLQSSASFQNLTSDWVETNFEPFSKHARSKPYFFAWNPFEFPNDVGYVWQPEGEEDIVPEFNGVIKYMNVAWNMVGLGHE